MTGSLQTKNGKFYMVLNCTENGKRKQKWIGTGLEIKGNKRKAEQMLRETLTASEKLQPIVKSDILLADCVRRWLPTAERRVDTVTYQGYELMAKSHILPYFDACGLRLCDVTTDVLQAFFDEKALSGRADGKGGLSPSTLRQYRNIISQSLTLAVKDGLIPSNPCQFVVLPKKIRNEAKFYSAAQLAALFKAIEGDPLEPLIRIAALYGLRRSEVLGLRWDSVDFENDLLTIRHTVTRVTETVAKDKTKSASSHRSFPLLPEAREIFEKCKAEETANRKLLKSSYHDNDYIFKWADGRTFSPDFVTHHFSLIVSKNNLPPLTFHGLRHSCASLLLNRGFNLKDVQEWMGHSDIQMTANIYGHLDTARKQAMASQLSGDLFGAC